MVASKLQYMAYANGKLGQSQCNSSSQNYYATIKPFPKCSNHDLQAQPIEILNQKSRSENREFN